MASSAKLHKSSGIAVSLPYPCPACRGQGKNLRPLPADNAGDPLGGIRIVGVTCSECGGSGRQNFSALPQKDAAITGRS